MHRSLHRSLLPVYILGDLALTALALFGAAVLRRDGPWGMPLDPALPVLPTSMIYPIALALWLVLFAAMEVYDPQPIISRKAALTNLLRAVPVATLALSGLLYLSFREVPRLLIIYFATIDLAALVLFRLIVGGALAVIQQRGACIRSAAIVGCNPVGIHVAAALRRTRWSDLRVVGYIDDRATKRGDDDGLPLLGSTAEIEALIERHRLDEIIIALPAHDVARVDPLVLRLLPVPVNVRLVPSMVGLSTYYATVDQIDGVPLVGLRDPMISGMSWVIKRSFDVVVALLGLICAAPLLLLALLLIWLDDGAPLVFRQQRVGENGRPFTIYKLRTMRVAATDAGSSALKSAGDPRVTRVGRWLRRFSIDELPQLWNVLRGDMSLVGPRPEVTGLMHRYQPWQRKRLAVPPGITGWWQINGRSDAPLHLNTDYDLYYIQHYSFWLDLVILLKTIGAVVRGRGAY